MNTVLFIGNGINHVDSVSISWDKLLCDLRQHRTIPEERPAIAIDLQKAVDNPVILSHAAH